jgi:hypothetical protein
MWAVETVAPVDSRPAARKRTSTVLPRGRGPAAVLVTEHGPVNFASGNPWKSVGTWSRAVP